MLEEYYDCVGVGWRTILEVLNDQLKWVMEQSKVRSELKVLQVKEKFGGLRVYTNHVGLEKDLIQRIWGATSFAESMSYRTCESCGATKEVETRVRGGDPKYSWTKTFCVECHAKRDAGERPLEGATRNR